MILRNRAKCLRCGEIVESTFTHDYKCCRCGALAVDGGHDYIRRSYKEEGCFEELSEFYEPSIEEIIQQVDGTMTLSDMPLTEEDKERIRLFYDDPDYLETIIQQLIEKHKNKGV